MKPVIGRAFWVIIVSVFLASCGVQVGSESARTPVTGSAGGGNAQGAMAQLERCDQSLGTLAVLEDQNSPWYHRLTNEYKLPSTVPLIRLLVQQSNCFVVVERGRGFAQLQNERALQQTGELRQGSNFGQGQIVAADYGMTPMITFSQGDTSGVGSALRVLPGYAGVLGSLAGGIKTREASTTLTLVDNRSGVQLAAAEGSAAATDFNAWGGVFGSGGGGSLGGYTNTPEGKVLAGAFADAYNRLVTAVKNYKAQEVKGGLGTGGTLGVQGGSTPASKALDPAPAAATKPAPKPAAKPAPKPAPKAPY
ncbi:MAG TPA: CsgG/HfaB family protein [Candidatus Binatia bacterium]|nr:CsgG/HfaB family protein [Candidatus Binatia bacterium]